MLLAQALYLVLRRRSRHLLFLLFFFFNDTATTEIYTLSLHDALPILLPATGGNAQDHGQGGGGAGLSEGAAVDTRSEEHTSELQSQSNLVCRLLLEKKKKIDHTEAPVLRTQLPHTLRRKHPPNGGHGL